MPHFETLERDLTGLVEGECSFDEETRSRYSTATSWYKIRPLGVFFPRSVDDIQAAVRFCHEYDISIIPRGAATGLAGQAIGMGIVFDFTRHMTGLRSVTESSVDVDAGVVVGSLNTLLEPTGRFFPIVPTSQELCTIGGMIATNAAGAHGVKYGATKDHVLEISAVLANGESVVFGKDTAATPQPTGSLMETICSGIPPLLFRNREPILSAFPKVQKNSSGYNLV
ncbi:MAG: FAD-binding oxidoreductase, partial [Bacteroidota bacterium]